MHDVIIIGGGIAGLAAATQLGRARRKVLVLDTGLPRNRYAPAAHGFITRDGATPAELRETALQQLATYRTVEVRMAAAIGARRSGDGFGVFLEGSSLSAKRLILAHGIVDSLDWLPGLAECWGKTAIHCPYCHGYEVADRRLGYLYGGHGDPLMPLTLYRDWSRDLTLFTNGHALSDEQRAGALALGAKIAEGKVTELIHAAGGLSAVRTESGSVPLDAIFVHAPADFASPVGRMLGCAIEQGHSAPYYTVDDRRQTSVPGVYAAGDASRPMHSITYAAADGVAAGSFAHHSLLFT